MGVLARGVGDSVAVGWAAYRPRPKPPVAVLDAGVADGVVSVADGAVGRRVAGASDTVVARPTRFAGGVG